MLDRLLTEQKEVKPVSRMKKMPAVLAPPPCSCWPVPLQWLRGWIRNLRRCLGQGEQEVRLIKDGVVQVDQRHTYENGWDG